MRINHVIIGTYNLELSEKFYSDLLEFNRIGSFRDTGTGNDSIILNFKDEKSGDTNLLLVPFLASRLPNPQHIAFEVSVEKFTRIYEKAKEMGLKIRAKPPLDSEDLGIGFLEIQNRRYRNFYVIDPAKVNVEIMMRV